MCKDGRYIKQAVVWRNNYDAHLADSTYRSIIFLSSGYNRNSYCLCCKLFSPTRFAPGCIIKSQHTDFAAHKVFFPPASKVLQLHKIKKHIITKAIVLPSELFFVHLFFNRNTFHPPALSLPWKSLLRKNLFFNSTKKGNQYQMVVEDASRGEKNLFTQQQPELMINGKWNLI